MGQWGGKRGRNRPVVSPVGSRGRLINPSEAFSCSLQLASYTVRLQARRQAAKAEDAQVALKEARVESEEAREKAAAASKPRRPPPPSADAAREDEDDDDDGAALDGTDSESGILSDPEETAAQEERLELRVAELRRKRGEAHDSTLKHTFKLLDCLIGQYKLNRVDAVLAEIADVCHAAKGRGASDWHVKYIQAHAF